MKYILVLDFYYLFIYMLSRFCYFYAWFFAFQTVGSEVILWLLFLPFFYGDETTVYLHEKGL